jgi:hypothetical protein
MLIIVGRDSEGLYKGLKARQEANGKDRVILDRRRGGSAGARGPDWFSRCDLAPRLTARTLSPDRHTGRVRATEPSPRRPARIRKRLRESLKFGPAPPASE